MHVINCHSRSNCYDTTIWNKMLSQNPNDDFSYSFGLISVNTLRYHVPRILRLKKKINTIQDVATYKLTNEFLGHVDELACGIPGHRGVACGATSESCHLCVALDDRTRGRLERKVLLSKRNSSVSGRALEEAHKHVEQSSYVTPVSWPSGSTCLSRPCLPPSPLIPLCR